MELLVVIAIIGLISAVALPVVVPALNERRVSEAARILQAVLSGTRDAAIRANAPRGIRLLPDPSFNLGIDQNSGIGHALASNRFIPIEPAPDYSEGVVAGSTAAPSMPPIVSSNGLLTLAYLTLAEVLRTSTTPSILNAPTGWNFNIRQGDRIRFNDSGAYYTIAGPVNGLAAAQNPERYVCYGGAQTEFLFLTNGVDDNGNGWIDESCDGIDNDGDGIIDPGFNGIDDDNKNGIDDPAEMFIGVSYVNGVRTPDKFAASEYEQEVFLGTESSSGLVTPGVVVQGVTYTITQSATLQSANYTIVRRPVVSPSAAETTLPAGVVIDLTTWDASAATPLQTQAQVTAGQYPPVLLPERSRLPVDPFSGYVDILIDQTGRVVPPGAGSGGGGYYANSPIASVPFYHFWITEREGVVDPLWGTQVQNNLTVLKLNSNYGTTTTSQNYFLPMPQGSPNYSGPLYLQGERRLVTLFTKTGQIVSNSIQNFDATNTSAPYYDAQSGTKESQ